MPLQLPREGRYQPRMRRHDWNAVRQQIMAAPNEWVLPFGNEKISQGTTSWLRRTGPVALHSIHDEIEWRQREMEYSDQGSQALGLLYARWTPGEKAPAYVGGKITDEQVRTAREEYSLGEISQTRLAQKYGMSAAGMNALLRGHTRASAGGPIHVSEEKN